MSLINGYMSNRSISEISIILGLNKLNGCEKEGLIKEDGVEKFREDFKSLVNMDEFKMMGLYGLKVMKNSEVEKLKMGVDGLLRKYRLGMILKSKLKVLREEVKEIMWGYYCENRLDLSEDIGEFREEIIIELMKGGDVKEVFELYGGSGLVKVA